ncbi:sugar ABC transporter substrate-binding protein [Arhodomonas sp. AD133]|uniref:sugar ABC transporter substrate-binding protein n=1 Tax=Arhodomonas sp. AD133 TaxID=3415009 RepID=UPI003EC0E4DA
MRNRLAAVAATFALSLTAGSALAQDSYDVAVVRWAPDDIYFNGVQLGQELERQRIEEKHGVDINFRVFGANDVGEQRNFLDAQLARGVDGVLLVPWRGEAMRASLAQMQRDNIPVVTSNAYVPDSEQVFVAFDNETAGRLGGEAIVNRLTELRGENWAEEGGVIVELRCIITASFDIDRHNGYRSVLDPITEKHDNLAIETREAGCNGGDARSAVEDIISRHGGGNLLAVASIDGTMGVGGAVPALKAQGLLYPRDDSRHIPVTTIDGTVPELQAVARGDIDHVSVQPAVGEGVMTMQLLWQQMNDNRAELPEIGATLNGDELWRPVQVMENQGFKGPWFKTQAYTVPGDVPHDDPRIWSNRMYKDENGSLPSYPQ